MPIQHRRVLDDRLMAYAATLRTSSFGGVLKRNVEKWPVYATVTGAALAMASSASASIIYSGALNKTASLKSNQNGTKNQTAALKSSHGARIGAFDLAVTRFIGGSIEEAAIGLEGTQPTIRLLRSSELLIRLSSGAAISTGAAAGGESFGTGFDFVKFQRISSSGSTLGWSKSKGFAGFDFFNAATDETDYGWIRLQYGAGKNGLIDSLTLVDWAYDNTGATITAGETVPVTTPEPSTIALMLLAAGAVGVGALRRRRRSAIAR